MTRVLFLCNGNSGRSEMAEGFARARADAGVSVASAGAVAQALHPLAIKVMAEGGIDISQQVSRTLADLGPSEVDVVVTLCEKAAHALPILPGNPECVHWNLPDPAAASGGEESVLRAFREVRDEIRRRVNDLFDLGYLHALAQAKRKADLILDNVHEGILAHDMDRRIFYFNKAAEEITGFKREEILSRICQESLLGGLCGAKCSFADGVPPDFDTCDKTLEISTKSGERRRVAMSLRMIKNAEGKNAGVLASFRDLTHEHELARRLGEIQHFSGIVGRDAKMQAVFDLVHDLADSTAPVMIQGESGTGKELIAAAIHNEGPRANKLFVPVNCGALPEGLLESELFGHVKGSFTGAIRDKKGRFELADGGTIFLDEIGDISPAMQVKLMRVLQEGRFERVGGEHTVQVDVRVISATNKQLDKEIAAGRFREDLYYRLSVVPITVPPLRERRNDIPLLVEHTLKRFLAETGKKDVTVSPESMDFMMSYDWPGNVRELQNWIQFALVKCKGPVIKLEHLPPMSLQVKPAGALAAMHVRRRKLDVNSVRGALAAANGNKVEAARALGVSRATLYRFLDAAGVE